MSVAIAVEQNLAEIVERIHENYKRSALALIDVGRDLMEAKKLVPHGEWANWLDVNFGLSQSSAHNFMRVAKQFGSNPDILNGCDFGSRVLYALAAPSTPEVAVDVAIHEARSAQVVTPQRVAEVKAEAQAGGTSGVYFGEDAASVVESSVVLEAGDPVEVTGITFASNPQLIYVRKNGVTFLVDRDDVSTSSTRLPVVPEFDEGLAVEGNRVEIVDRSFDRPPQSVEEESDRRAVALGLSKSRVQVLPDVDRREAPESTPFQSNSVLLGFRGEAISVSPPPTHQELIELLQGAGYRAEMFRGSNV